MAGIWRSKRVPLHPVATDHLIHIHVLLSQTCRSTNLGSSYRCGHAGGRSLWHVAWYFHIIDSHWADCWHCCCCQCFLCVFFFIIIIIHLVLLLPPTTPCSRWWFAKLSHTLFIKFFAHIARDDSSARWLEIIKVFDTSEDYTMWTMSGVHTMQGGRKDKQSKDKQTAEPSANDLTRETGRGSHGNRWVCTASRVGEHRRGHGSVWSVVFTEENEMKQACAYVR